MRQLPGVVDLSPHVLHVTDAFPPEHGGVERVIEHLAAGQVAHGWRVTVLTKSVPAAPRVELRADGVYVLRYQQAAQPTPWMYATTIYGAGAVAAGLRRCDPPDIVHYHLTLSAQGPLSVFRRVPTVYSFYGPWHGEFAVESEELLARSGAGYRAYLRAQMNAQRIMQRRLLRRADRVVVLSEFSRSRVSEIAPERAAGAVVIPGGVDPAHFHPAPANDTWRTELGLPADAFVVLTVRRLARRMGIDLLLEALARVRAEGINAVCLIAGSGPLRAELERQARVLGLGDAVRFLGFVADERLPDLYRLADLFVVPTRAEENFGLIILEAAACGTPVAATPAGSLPELLQLTNPGGLAHQVSAEALTEVLRRAVVERVDTRDQAREVVAPRIREQFAWTRIVDRLLALYADLGVR